MEGAASHPVGVEKFESALVVRQEERKGSGQGRQPGQVEREGRRVLRRKW